MADMLKFRKGTYAQINAAPKAAGTIYIARDEKAMYVDVDADTRIRIGDFIRVDTVKDIIPPYSTSSLYYVENDNALLKYDGSNWKQVNGTDDLKDRLTTAENAIDAVEGLVGSKTDATTVDSAFGRIAKNKADISTLNTYVGTIPEGATSTNVVDYIKEKTTGIATSDNLDALTTRVTTAEGKITTLESSSANHESRIATLEEKDVALKSDVAAAKTAILGQTEGGADFVGTVKGAYEAAATAQAQADKGVTNAATAQTKANANEQAISGLTNRVTALDDATTGEVPLLKARVQTLETAGYATVSQVTEAKNEVLGTASDDAGKATVHGALKSAAAADAKAVAATNAASAAQGDIDAWEEAHKNDYKNTKIDELVADAKQAGTDAQTALNTYKGQHDKDYTNEQINAKVQAVQDKVDENTGTLTTLTGAATVPGSVAEAKKAGDDALALIGNADGGLTKTVNSHTADLEILRGADTVNGSVANAKKAGTDAQATANANAGEIATLKGAVGTAKKGTGDGSEGNDAATGLYKVIEDSNAALKTELSAEIDADIRSANAMTFKKIINSQSDFDKITEAQVGDTYVIGTAFGNYQAGDFLIAGGEENEVTGNIITIEWNHVKSGYDASLDQRLTGADNKIKLSTGTGLAGTEVAFAATGSASVAVANNTVTIGMVWEDFGE